MGIRVHERVQLTSAHLSYRHVRPKKVFSQRRASLPTLTGAIVTRFSQEDLDKSMRSAPQNLFDTVTPHDEFTMSGALSAWLISVM
jgi:hypothetical protein